ncbi:MAG: SIS domain-containing protein [Akkermansiaceae bacterium]|nr:SIS domain-containing protein [Akkermansiaceae bacterium]NNM28005.1 SIS domain-containing protein [Akkermansiaceae bacterium]
MKSSEDYLRQCAGVISAVAAQKEAIDRAADWFAETILAGRVVHLFGSGHSRIMVEEMWPRYGSFPGWNPIVELSLTFHNLVTGANGQRQAMFLENVPGFAGRILRNFGITADDAALIISSSGTSVVPCEMAEGLRARGAKVVAMVSRAHSEGCEAKRDDGRKLTDFADLVLDTGAPPGDAAVAVDGLDEKVAPLSTVGGVILINAIKAGVAERLVQGGAPPKVLAAAGIVGAERSTALFEAAYDEHARRMAKLSENLGS